MSGGVCMMPSSTSSGASRTGQIRKVAVLGAGTMGSRIAAHIANAGVPVVLLDIVPPGVAADAPKADRNKFALAAMDGLKKSKPAAFYALDAARLITLGNFDDDLALIADCDWIIEAVAENLEIKRALLAKVQQHRRPGAITTSNTSGLPVARIVEGMDEELRQHWFGTHFFNPPRYMRLLELIATAESSAEDMALVTRFCDQRLGKAVVRSHDTPNFIANRIGTFEMMNAARLMMEQGLTVEEVDALTGAALGWPKTGTFRLADMVGVDVLAHVAKNFAAQAAAIGDERDGCSDGSVYYASMLEKSSGSGIRRSRASTKKEGRDAEGRDLRHVLDWLTLDYKPSTRPKFPALEMAKKNVEVDGCTVAAVVAWGCCERQGRGIYWPLLTELFTYAANRVPEIADDIVAIDTAMKTGFNWELGPFEMFDAVGVRAVTEEDAGCWGSGLGECGRSC